MVFPKYKKGGYIVRKVTVEPTYRKTCMCLWYLIYYINFLGYVDELVQKTVDLCKAGYRPPSSEIPESLCSAYERPDKSVAISGHKSRFTLGH